MALQNTGIYILKYYLNTNINQIYISLRLVLVILPVYKNISKIKKKIMTTNHKSDNCLFIFYTESDKSISLKIQKKLKSSLNNDKKYIN